MPKRGRSEMHGGVFIVLGIFLLVASIVVNVSTEKNFALFMVAGAGMAVYGFFKLGTKPKKQDSLQDMHGRYQQQMIDQQRRQQMMAQQQGQNTAQHMQQYRRMQK